MSTESEVLRNGVHILTTALLVIAIFTSVNMPMDLAISNLMVLSTFAAIYFAGWTFMDQWNQGAKAMWLGILTVMWFCDMLLAPAGMYLVFTLFFLYMRVFEDWRGVVLTCFATALSIAVQVPHGVTFGGAMGPVVSALVMLAIHYSMSKLERINRELKDTRQQLADTERAAGVAAERQRIAHDIHDTVAQGLSSIQMLLHAADRDLDVADFPQDARARERIALARRTASESLAEARAMIAALQPAVLAETSLAGALERMVAGFAETADITIDVDVEGEERQLPMKVEAALLRIAQGAVGNVMKHSQATRARVTVTYDEDEVRVDVVDNGRGFNPVEVEARPAGLGHIGLTAMRRRAEELGGQVIIESAPGEGTAVSIAMPLGEAGVR